ncbi:hypothetical protein NHX12_017094 [Muraenolepis orangiensis]|uniref:Secreted phosphoprotein 24 n=1 Tax=Muraenolepis orangiensis TaxID=630683 RepID=A0A9Q0D5V3_9TELE|nr:hypothetical protein NHX12_017094 [Muraenolepis orangiensis]
MKWCVLFLALLQSLGCFCFPAPKTSPIVTKGLEAALSHFNTRLAGTHLHRAITASLTKVIPIGLNNYDLLYTFVTKETMCLKSSGQDAQTCALNPMLFLVSGGH